MNNLTTLVTPDTTHLSEKGSLQVSEYLSFVRSKFDDIKKGELAKQQVARYYLEQELTEGADKLISSINDALGISKGYLSKIRSASKFIDGLGSGIADKQLKSFVQEHPVSVQYYISKLDKETINSKMLSGERFTRKELEVSRETPDTIPNPSPVVLPQSSREQQLVDGDKKFIDDMSVASAYTMGMRPVIKAALQYVTDSTVLSEHMELGLLALAKEINSAVARSQHRRAEAEKKTSIMNHRSTN